MRRQREVFASQIGLNIKMEGGLFAHHALIANFEVVLVRFFSFVMPSNDNASVYRKTAPGGTKGKDT